MNLIHGLFATGFYSLPCTLLTTPWLEEWADMTGILPCFCSHCLSIFFFFLPPAHPSTAFLTQLSTRQEDSRISTMPALSLRSVTRSGKKSHTNSYLVQSALCVPFFFVMGKNQFIRLPPLSLLLSMF